MVGAGLYFIDSVDMFTTYGAAILKGSYNSLFAYPNAKEPLQNDWFEYDGLDVDLTDRYFDNISVNIQFVIISNVSVADLVAKRDAFNNVLRAAGYRNLYLSGMQVGLQLRYISSNEGDVGTVAPNKNIYSFIFQSLTLCCACHILKYLPFSFTNSSCVPFSMISPLSTTRIVSAPAIVESL